MKQLAVFLIQLLDGLLVAFEKQVYDFFIIYHLTASFPASLIYYGFRDEYYIKSKAFSKNIPHLA